MPDKGNIDGPGELHHIIDGRKDYGVETGASAALRGDQIYRGNPPGFAQQRPVEGCEPLNVSAGA
jgi:hypothetical protein